MFCFAVIFFYFIEIKLCFTDLKFVITIYYCKYDFIMCYSIVFVFGLEVRYERSLNACLLVVVFVCPKLMLLADRILRSIF